jgi:hypothetical protein
MSDLCRIQQRFSHTIHRPDRQTVLIASACGAAAFVLLLLFTPHGFELGDAPYYAEYIAARELGYASKHIGYYLLGIAFTSIVPLEFNYSLNVLSALTGAISVGLAASVAYTLSGKKTAMLGAAVLMMTPYTFVTSAVNAEVYAPQLCFFLLSIQLALLTKPVAAGLSYAAACLITPSTVLLAPFMATLLSRRKDLLLAAAATMLPVLAVLAPVLGDFLWGPHGVIGLPPGNLTLWTGLWKEWWELRGFSLGLVFVGLGLWALIRSRSHRLFLAALFAVWLLSLLLGEHYSDVPVQLPLYGMFSVIGGIGFAWTAHRLQRTRLTTIGLTAALVAIGVVAGSTTYVRVAEETACANTMRESFEEMERCAQSGDVAVAPFSVALLGRYYLGEDEVVWVTDDALAGKSGADERAASERKLQGALLARKCVYLPGEFDDSAYAFFTQQDYEVAPFESMFVARPTAGTPTP